MGRAGTVLLEKGSLKPETLLVCNAEEERHQIERSRRDE